jgi:hypothetical protein
MNIDEKEYLKKVSNCFNHKSDYMKKVDSRRMKKHIEAADVIPEDPSPVCKLSDCSYYDEEDNKGYCVLSRKYFIIEDRINKRSLRNWIKDKKYV